MRCLEPVLRQASFWECLIYRGHVGETSPPHEGRTAKLCTRFIRQNWKSIKFCIIMNRSPRPGGPPHRNGCNKRQPGVTTRTNFSLQQPVHLSSSSSFCNYEEKNYENGWGRHKCGLLNVIVIHNKCAWQTIQNTTWNCKMQNREPMPSIAGGNAPSYCGPMYEKMGRN